ncbi:hypothetical protein SDC9_122448 [bioreactor metagenome]|uniref:Uncharacterized protein n=1 Tax=bioreactor metagenome TaxID=1076179 RepID=A0A645CEX6_9ZZZZ
MHRHVGVNLHIAGMLGFRAAVKIELPAHPHTPFGHNMRMPVGLGGTYPIIDGFAKARFHLLPT